MNQPLDWGHIAGSAWNRVPGSTFGHGIVRPKARWRLVQIPWPADYAPGGKDLFRWIDVGDSFHMDLGIPDLRQLPQSLQQIVEQLHNVPPTYLPRDARVEEFNYALDRFLWLLDHLVQSNVPIGLVSPVSIRVLVRDRLDYCRVAELRQRDEKSLNYNDRELISRAQIGREIVLTDLGLIQTEMYSGDLSSLRKDSPFAFLWLPDPVSHHQTPLNQTEAIGFSVRLIAWLLAKAKVSKIPKTESLASYGPCWPVLAQASAGQFKTVEEFRKALQASPPSTHAFGKELPASYFSQPDDPVASKIEPANSRSIVFIAIIVAMSMIGFVITFLFMWKGT